MDIRKKVASSTTNPLNDKGKDTNKNPQIKLLAECFSEKPKTMYQVEQETGVKNDNISRFIVKDEEKLYQTQGGNWKHLYLTQAIRNLCEQPRIL